MSVAPLVWQSHLDAALRFLHAVAERTGWPTPSPRSAIFDRRWRAGDLAVPAHGIELLKRR